MSSCMDSLLDIVGSDDSFRVMQAGCGEMFMVSSEDYADVSEHAWYVSGPSRGKKYIQGHCKELDRSLLLHRLLIGALPSEQVDHINGNSLDNRRENLRICTRQQNCFNKKKWSKSKNKYKGVQQRTKGSFQARIRSMGQNINIGHYGTAEEAAKAYNEKAKELFGKFAWLNDV